MEFPYTGSMKLPLIFVAAVTALIAPITAYADTSVDISNNGEGSTNRVEINNQANTGSESSTDVTIETNGQVKTFHAQGNQNINWQSDNGNNQIHVNNQSNQRKYYSSRNTTSVNTQIYSHTNPENNNSASELLPTVPPQPTSHPAPSKQEIKHGNDQLDLLSVLKRQMSVINTLTIGFMKTLLR